MGNQGWSNSGGESVPSTARTTGVTTDTSAAQPFTRGSNTSDMNTPLPDTFGDRDDLFEVPGQLSTS
jgi:hypothetical protein